MEFSEIIQKRRSIRAYQDRPIDPAIIDSILQAVNSAPSAGNLQAYEIFRIEDPDQRADLARAAKGQDFINQAPLALVFCAHPARSEWRYHARGANLYSVQDATIACTYAMLAALEFGLGSVWVGAFHDDAVKAVLGNPEGLTPVAILPLGYPAEHPPARTRRPLAEIVHHG